MGIAIFSPPLDSHGNSVKGVKFCQELLKHYPFGVFDSLAAKAVRPHFKATDSPDMLTMRRQGSSGAMDAIIPPLSLAGNTSGHGASLGESCLRQPVLCMITA